jgi:hypothetical protein
MHAVIDEAWAKGEFASNGNASQYADPAYFFQNSALDLSSAECFSLDYLSFVTYGDLELNRRAASLLGEEYQFEYGSDVSTWSIGYLFAAPGSDATAATADGFAFGAYPEGFEDGKPCIAVTYKMNRFDADTVAEWLSALAADSIAYDANAGYEVYHLTYYLD